MFLLHSQRHKVFLKYTNYIKSICINCRIKPISLRSIYLHTYLFLFRTIYSGSYFRIFSTCITLGRLKLNVMNCEEVREYITWRVTEEAEFGGISNQNGNEFSPNFFFKRSWSLVIWRLESSEVGGNTWINILETTQK